MSIFGVEEAKLPSGWLARQMHRVAVDCAMWPAAMRREGCFDDRNLTLEQRKEAASKLRARANELDPQNVSR